MNLLISSNFLVFALGVILGIIVAYGVLNLLNKKRIIEKKTDPIYYRIFSRKKENLRKIVEYLEKNERITNNEVEKLIEVSDSSVGRYLDELEKYNVIVRKGKTKRSSYYVLK